MVVLDWAFVRQEARAAVRQFFAPLTWPFRKRLVLRTFIRLAKRANVALMLGFLALAGCAHDQGPPTAPTSSPKAPPPALCQPIEPEPDVAGGIVAPVTEAEREFTTKFLGAELSVRLWGRSMRDRAQLAKTTYCE